MDAALVERMNRAGPTNSKSAASICVHLRGSIDKKSAAGGGQPPLSQGNGYGALNGKPVEFMVYIMDEGKPLLCNIIYTYKMIAEYLDFSYAFNNPSSWQRYQSVLSARNC